MTTATKTIQDMTPEEIDEILFPIWARRWQIAEHLQSYRAGIAYTVWPSAAPSNGMGGRKHGVSTVQFRQWHEAILKLEDEDATLAADQSPYDVEFDRRGGWSRYVLCGARNGHLHYRGCSSLRWDTRLLLIPQASGLDSSDVVGKFGETACTKCFPGAPVAPKVKTIPEGVCPGSGTYEVDDSRGSLRLYRPWGVCRVCRSSASVTSTGKLRQHKTPKGASS